MLTSTTITVDLDVTDYFTWLHCEGGAMKTFICYL